MCQSLTAFASKARAPLVRVTKAANSNTPWLQRIGKKSWFGGVQQGVRIEKRTIRDSTVQLGDHSMYGRGDREYGSYAVSVRYVTIHVPLSIHENYAKNNAYTGIGLHSSECIFTSASHPLPPMYPTSPFTFTHCHLGLPATLFQTGSE